jgi:MarR family
VDTRTDKHPEDVGATIQGRKRKKSSLTAGASATGERYGKFPNIIATMEGLSFEATAYLMYRSLFCGDFGLNNTDTARRFQEGRTVTANRPRWADDGKIEPAECSATGMGRDVTRRARRQLRDKGLLRRWQPGRAYCKEQVLADQGGRRYRRVEAGWFNRQNILYKEIAVLGYVRGIGRRGATVSQIAKRFGCSYPTASKLCKAMVEKRLLRKEGTPACPVYVCAMEPAPYKNSGGQTRKNSGAQAHKNSGRKLSINQILSLKKNTGCSLRPKDDAGSERIEGASGTVGADKTPGVQAESDQRPPRVSVRDGCVHTVARELVDRAHLHDLFHDLFPKLAKRVSNKALKPVEDVDAFFARMIDKALRQRHVRCNLAAGHEGPQPQPLPPPIVVSPIRDAGVGRRYDKYLGRSDSDGHDWRSVARASLACHVGRIRALRDA